MTIYLLPLLLRERVGVWSLFAPSPFEERAWVRCLFYFPSLVGEGVRVGEICI
jgi:hypothetical protein